MKLICWILRVVGPNGVGSRPYASGEPVISWFRNLNVNRYTMDYCYRQLLFNVRITYTDRKTNIWVRDKANTLLNKSEDGSGLG